MFYRAVAATCPGNDKDYNSSNIYLNAKYITNDIKSSEVLLKQKSEQKGLQFYAIAEGFGADDYSDEASLIAVKQLSAIQKKAMETEIGSDYDESADAIYSYLEDFVRDSDAAIAAKMEESGGKNIYASVAAIGFNETAAITCNLGNTRIYLFRKGGLNRLTEDHNQAQVMYSNGVIPEDRLASHPKKNKLTQYLGVMPEENKQEPYYSELEVKHGDIFIICSNSFCNSVDDESICAMVKDSHSLSQIAERLMHAAAQKGFDEDTSIVVIRADSHEKTAAGAGAGAGARTAAAGAAAVGSGTRTAAAAGKRGGNLYANNKSNASASGSARYSDVDLPENDEGEEETGIRKYMTKLKNALGFGADSSNEKMLPALLMFGGCILVVVILTILGIKIYNASKAPSPGGYSSYIETPAPGSPTQTTSSASPSPSLSPSPEGSQTPSATPSGQTGSPAVTDNTQGPTAGNNTEPPVTDAPTQAPTEPPTQAPTQRPTQAPTQAPTQRPTQAPTEPPTQAPTEQPTESPTESPTEEPTETPTIEPTPTADETDEPPVTEETPAPEETPVSPGEGDSGDNGGN